MTSQSHQGITAIVLCRNDATHLDNCLRSLRWADELLVINIESTDNTLEIASQWADRIISHRKCPSIKMAYAFAAAQARNEWVILAQPTDRLNEPFAKTLKTMLPFRQDTAMLQIPRQFHLKSKPLSHTPWGQKRHAFLPIINTYRCQLQANTPQWCLPTKQNTIDTLNASNDIPIHCVWGNSIWQLFTQWRRAIPAEAYLRYISNTPIKLSAFTTQPIKQIFKAMTNILDLKNLLWEISDAAFDVLVNCVQIGHKIRRSTKPNAQDDSSNMRHAA